MMWASSFFFSLRIYNNEIKPLSIFEVIRIFAAMLIQRIVSTIGIISRRKTESGKINRLKFADF